MGLADGRVMVVWCVAGDRSTPSAGIHYCISHPGGGGGSWDPAAVVTILPGTLVVGRYYSPRTFQLDDGQYLDFYGHQINSQYIEPYLGIHLCSQ